MKFGKIYTDLTKNPEETSKPAQTVEQNNDNEARASLVGSWKQSTITQEIVRDILSEIDSLIAKSITLAVNYPINSNHQQIIQNLTRVDTLQKILDKYIYAK